MSTEIQWTDETWNPVTGCTKVSPGCAHCYAEGVANRFWKKQYPDFKDESMYPAVREFTDVMTHADRLDQPLHWKKPRKVFVNSMSDLFHEDVPDSFIDQVCAVMALAPQHTFQVLTKRAERMQRYFAARDLRDRVSVIAADSINDPDPEMVVRFWPLLNVWLGVSVENQAHLHRIDTLKDVPAAIRFVSFEPLLEDLGALILDGIHWAIFGGESGPGARPCALEWIDRGVNECARNGVAPFVKQLGSFVVSEARTMDEEVRATLKHPERCLKAGPGEYWAWRAGLRDPKGGDISEFPEHLQIREFPCVQHG